MRCAVPMCSILREEDRLLLLYVLMLFMSHGLSFGSSFSHLQPVWKIHIRWVWFFFSIWANRLFHKKAFSVWVTHAGFFFSVPKEKSVRIWKMLFLHPSLFVIMPINESVCPWWIVFFFFFNSHFSHTHVCPSDQLKRLENSALSQSAKN